jgi:hypothetical protein
MYYMNTTLRIIFNIAMPLLLVLQTSCFRHYYKISTPVVDADLRFISMLKNDNRYFILRSGLAAWHMSNIILSKDEKIIRCHLEDVPPEHQLHLREGQHGNMQYRTGKHTRVVLTEVHFFVPQDLLARNGLYLIPVEEIQRIEVIDKDGVRTLGSYVGGTLAVAGSVVAIVYATSILLLLTFFL